MSDGGASDAQPSVEHLTRQFFAAIDERDPERMLAVLAPLAVFRSLPHAAPIRTSDEVVAYFGSVVSSYPGARWSVTDVITDGSRAAVQFVIREFSTSHNREVISEQIAIVRATEGKITSIVGYYDTTEFRRLFWDEE